MDAIELFQRIHADIWFFDLDGTLYSNTKVIDGVFRQKYCALVAELYELTVADAPAFLDALQQRHETRLMRVALAREGVPISVIAKKTLFAIDSIALGLALPMKRIEVITAARGSRYVLTDSPEQYARAMLAALGVEELFAKVFAAEDMDCGLASKPEPAALRKIEECLRRSERVVFVDDQLDNVTAVAELSSKIVTVLVSRDREQQLDAPHYWVDSLDE